MVDSGAPSGEDMLFHVFTVCNGQLIQLWSNMKPKTEALDVEKGEAFFFLL